MLSWENFSIDLLNTNKALKSKYFRALNPTSGYIKRGQMMAMLGESGSGKTTFIQSLSGRIPPNSRTTGRILVNGKERDLDKWSKECSLIEQSNTLIGELDIIEILTYVAMFHGIEGDIKAKAEQLVRYLNLENVMYCKTRALSGGETKRCAIAISLMVDPSIILLDEPTSGLDTKNAYNLIYFLKKLAVEKKKTIIVSLHQPGNRILKMFDKIMLITKGQVVYCDDSEKMFPFFEKFGFKIEPSVSMHENISDIIDQRDYDKINQIDFEKIDKRDLNVHCNNFLTNPNENNFKKNILGIDNNYEEINTQKEKLRRVTEYLNKELKSEYKIPVKKNLFRIDLMPNLIHIYYLTKRQFHVSYQGVEFYLKPLLQIFIFSLMCSVLKILKPLESGNELNPSFDGSNNQNLNHQPPNDMDTISSNDNYGLMANIFQDISRSSCESIGIAFMGFSGFKIIHPLFTEAFYVEKEILCNYYTPSSYWIALLIFLSSKMFLTNLIISKIFISTSDLLYNSSHFWYFTLLPLTYIPYQLFLTFMFKDIVISSGFAYIINFLFQFAYIIQGIAAYSKNTLISKYSLILYLDPQTFVIDIFQLMSRGEDPIGINSLSYFSNYETLFKYLGTEFGTNKEKIAILLAGLSINVVVMSMLSILMFSYWYMPTIRLTVGKKK